MTGGVVAARRKGADAVWCNGGRCSDLVCVRTWLQVCGGHGGARVKKMRAVTVLHVSRASGAVMVVRGTSFAEAWWCA